MRVRQLFLALAAAILVAPAARADARQGRPVMPTRTWDGIIRGDETLQKESPSTGFLTDAGAFEKLWKAWRPKEPVPKVDFTRELALVATAKGPNRVGISASLDDKGDLKVRSRATLIGGPGFGYAIVIIPREGIKTVRGKPLAE